MVKRHFQTAFLNSDCQAHTVAFSYYISKMMISQFYHFQYPTVTKVSRVSNKRSSHFSRNQNFICFLFPLLTIYIRTYHGYLLITALIHHRKSFFIIKLDML